MKKLIFIFFTAVYCLSAQNNKLLDVDKIMYSYININSIEELSKRIDYDFKTKKEKVRALYTWIALNIKYQKKNPNLIEVPKKYIVYNNDELKRRLQIERKETIKNTFSTKKGVCEGYAFLFQKVCSLLHIKNELVFGYVRRSINDIGYIPTDKNHVWNAVEIDNEWIFIDTTWGAGYILNGVWQQKLNTSFFDIKKEDLRLTHYPSDVYWLRYLKQKPLKDFCNQPIYNIVFLKSKAELIIPNNGIIKTRKNKQLKLKIKNLNPNTQILYRYANSRYAKYPVLTSKNLITSITILGTNKNDELYIYFDNNLALSYRIEVN